MPIGRYVTVQGSSFMLDGPSTRQMFMGLKVDRTPELPPTGTKTIFEVQGGRILLLNLIGEVTEVLGAVGTNLKIQANPTATGSSVDICAVAAIANLALATLLSVSGVAATALQTGLAVVGMTTPWVIQAGSIDMNASAAVGGGLVKWSLFYVPIDDDAVVVASYA